MKTFLFPILLLMLTHCANVKSIEQETKESEIENLAQSHFKEKYATKKNESGTYTIVFKKYKKIEDLFATVKFFIFEEETQSIIFQDELKAGSILWHSDSKIVAISRNLKTDTDKNKESTSTYYYDVNLKRITKMH